MPTKILAFISGLLLAFTAPAQGDSLAFTIDSVMKDGVYISYYDFRHKRAVHKEQVNSVLDKGELNFLEKNMKQETFSYIKNDTLQTIPSNRVWGFFQNNTLYINYSGSFCRVPLFGAISYFIGNVTDTQLLYVNSFGMPNGTTNLRQFDELLMDFYDGHITTLNMSRAKALLSRDKTLYYEYQMLPRRQRKTKLNAYFRRYNARNPVYFLK